MKVYIKGLINVEGIWWPITFESVVPAGLTADKKIAHIHKVIGGLKDRGNIISAVAGTLPPTNALPADPPPGPAEKSNQASFEWPAPTCTTHHEEMTESKIQKEEGFTHYYCPKRLGEGYCPARAKVNQKNAVPKFWEVKGS